MTARLTGQALIVVGAMLAAPQLFVTYPAQGVFAAGLLIALIGGVMICDAGH
jgi:hypothetical protein